VEVHGVPLGILDLQHTLCDDRLLRCGGQLDEPASSARSSEARTPTSTFRACSLKPAIAGLTASFGVRSAAAAWKLE
jgi:hypothetical protein